MIQHLMRSRRGIARTTLALFATVWLNMAMQPCLMAAEPMLPDGHGDCPHCPPAEHCVDVDELQCDFLDDYDFDGRTPAQPDPHPVFEAAPSAECTAPARAPTAGLHQTRKVEPDHGPPPYKRACRYLN